MQRNRLPKQLNIVVAVVPNICEPNELESASGSVVPILYSLFIGLKPINRPQQQQQQQ